MSDLISVLFTLLGWGIVLSPLFAIFAAILIAYVRLVEKAVDIRQARQATSATTKQKADFNPLF